MDYKGTLVTLENYHILFKDYSLDIRDEVRSAVIDGLDVSKYIEACKNDPYRLNQIRLGIKENVPIRYFSLNGTVLYEVRKALKVSKDLSAFDKYINAGFNTEQYTYILSWLLHGFRVEKCNLRLLPKNLWRVFNYGVLNKYPMEIFCTGHPYSERYITSCLHLLANGDDVTPYLSGEWDESVLEALVSYVNKPYYKKVRHFLTPRSKPDYVDSIFECAQWGMELSEVGRKDEEGYNVYMPFQISWMIEAHRSGLDWSALCDPMLGNGELSKMVDEMQYESNKGLHVKIKKG